MNCPVCGSHDLGRIAPDHYYCWDCFVEIDASGSESRAFTVDPEGVLIPIGEGPPAGAVAGGVEHGKEGSA